MDAFSPLSDTRAFRDSLGKFATGVTIVTAQSPKGPIGITANSFSSISLTPPLVMWAPAKLSSRHDLFVNSQHFAIHVLSDQQKDLCDAFAKPQSDLTVQPHRLNNHDVPIFEDCLAIFECTTFQVHDAGDHSIVIGHVNHAQQSEGIPLIFSQGKFYTNPQNIE